MQMLLEILDQHLKSKRPEFYAGLNDPLTEAEILALENKFKVVLPADLKALYRWKNGQRDDVCEAFANNSMFTPLDEMLDSAAELTSMIGLDFEIENWWHKDWLPVFHNGGGNYICYDSGGLFTGQRGQLLEYWNDDSDRNVIAPDLESFITSLNDYYAKVSADDFDEYFEVEHMEGFPKKYILNA